jgi:hypothetical protein
MKHSNKLLVAASVAVFFAAPRVEAAGWYAGPIDHVELTSLGEILLFLKGPTNHECGSKRVDYVTQNDGPGRSILAALLAWQAQGKSVNVYIASCSGTVGIFNTVVDN